MQITPTQASFVCTRFDQYCSIARLGVLVSAVWLLVLPSVSVAGSVVEAFSVRVRLLPADPTNRGPSGEGAGGSVLERDIPNNICTITGLPSAYGAEVRVVCTTGQFIDLRLPRGTSGVSPQHGGAAQWFISSAPDGMGLSGMQQGGAGTVSSIRLVSSAGETSLASQEAVEVWVSW